MPYAADDVGLSASISLWLERLPDPETLPGRRRLEPCAALVTSGRGSACGTVRVPGVLRRVTSAQNDAGDAWRLGTLVTGVVFL